MPIAPLPGVPARDLAVVLYGATGYTGRLIARELDASGASFAVAGRDRTKLEALASSLDTAPEVVVAATNDVSSLEAMAQRARAVVSAAGPFVDLGPPIVEACLAARTPFADITGEQSYLRWCWDQESRAKTARVPIVNAVGFDVIPSDLAAVLASRGLERVERLDIAIHNRAPGRAVLSRGTRRSMAAMRGPVWFDGGRFRTAVPGRFSRAFAFPEGEREGAFIPWGDVVTAPRSTGARQVRTFFILRPNQVRSMHVAWPITAVVRATGLLANRLARRAEAAPEGPSDEERAAARFAILAEATDASGRVQRGLVSGRDPYGLTGAIAARAALTLSRGGVGRAGVLTPSQAFDLEPFLAPLAKRFDLRWERLPGPPRTS